MGEPKLDLDTPAGWEQYAAQVESLDSFVDRAEEIARRVLSEAGLPDDLRLHAHGPGRWSKRQRVLGR